jgi:hypothetical protein
MGISRLVVVVALVACGGETEPPPDASLDALAKTDSSKPDASTRVPLDHRATAVACPSARGSGPPTQPYPQKQSNGCSSDSDCTAGKNGRCFPSEPLVSGGGCSYDECFVDSDCATKTPCACRASSTDNAANVCDPGGNCAVDSDCGPNGYCSPSVSACGGPAPYFCHTPADECIDDSDCPPATSTGCETTAFCAFDTQRWSCTQLTCCPP